ncbi:hypothetical protein D3C72_1129010 [compost metagenome]
MPGFQVRADGALALAALVHGHGRVVHHLQERHHALRFAVGALDVAAQCAHAGPVVAQAAGELRQQRVFLDRLVDAVQVVGHGGQVAAGQLRAQRAGVEQGGRARHEVERRQHFVELDGAGFAVDFVQRQAHGHAHEERLRQLDAGLAHVQEVAVVQGLQAQVVELVVALGLQGGAQAGQVVLQQLLVEQLVLDALLDELREVVGVGGGALDRHHFAADDFLEDRVQQQARGGEGVVGVLLDQRAGGQDGGLVDLVQRHAVVQVAHRLGDDGGGGDAVAQALAGRFDQALELVQVQRHALAVVEHVQRRCGGHVLLALLRTFLGAAFAVQHVGARDFMVAAAHQAELDLVLHVFDVEGAAARTRADHGADHALRQRVDGLAHAGGSRALGAVHRQEGLHHRDGDLVRFEGNDGAVAANDLVVREVLTGGRARSVLLLLRRRGDGAGGRRGVQCSLHSLPLGCAILVGWQGLAGLASALLPNGKTLYLGCLCPTSHYR